MQPARKPYPFDVSYGEWSLVVPYLTLVRIDAVQRHHALRELFNGLPYVIRYGIAWRAMPNDLQPWFAVSAIAGSDGGHTFPHSEACPGAPNPNSRSTVACLLKLLRLLK
jgi:hypothetical protein